MNPAYAPLTPSAVTANGTVFASNNVPATAERIALAPGAEAPTLVREIAEESLPGDVTAQIFVRSLATAVPITTSSAVGAEVRLHARTTVGQLHRAAASVTNFSVR